MHKRQLIARKPAYRHGQLLLEDDFIDEQRFHVHARDAHNRELHGFGVVRGLELAPAGERAVSIGKGIAIDRRGRQIELREPETLELAGLPAGARADVSIGYRTESLAQDGSGENRIDCYAVLRIATGVEVDDVRLGRVQTDERGRIVANGVTDADRDRLRTAIAPGSVDAEALAPALRRGWVTVAFHPSSMPQDEDDARPPFRVGATQAVAHEDWNGAPNKRGAAGTMTIVLPPGVRALHALRVAGTSNKAAMTATLIRGGFDGKKHARDELLTLRIASGESYCETGSVPEAHRNLPDDGMRTLAVDLRAEGFVKVSLVALDVSY